MDQAFPGERLGRPRLGPQSVARPGRRIAGILIDFGVSFAVYALFFFGDQWASLIIFAVLQYVFITLFSGSIGHLAAGLRVTPLRGGWCGLWRPALRTILLCLFVPAVIWDRDQRGLHDVLSGLVIVRA
ncbi:RDD family protein [Naasia lichenicola]|uniref:RDD family protein n=1 Tax=Naasia lichenicola TaxID=2565933 RepID=A0A4S4FS76_9MICO|nr:RDD family protein [Naasia lichenicola]THG33570.1 RDD family protein [Naasia lichenicola]